MIAVGVRNARDDECVPLLQESADRDPRNQRAVLIWEVDEESRDGRMLPRRVGEAYSFDDLLGRVEASDPCVKELQRAKGWTIGSQHFHQPELLIHPDRGSDDVFLHNRPDSLRSSWQPDNPCVEEPIFLIRD